MVVLIVLGVSAVGGAQIAERLGIDLNAFSVVGGMIVAGMGFESFTGACRVRHKGRDTATSGPDERSGLIMPMAIPLIAGPGSIVTAVTVSTSNEVYGSIIHLPAYWPSLSPAISALRGSTRL